MLRVDRYAEPLWNRSVAQEIDRRSVGAYAVPALQLMEEAGKGVSDEIVVRYDRRRPVIVLAGTGNNGGDGVVAARYLRQRGFNTHIFLVREPATKPLSAGLQHQIDAYKAIGATISPYTPGVLAAFCDKQPIIIDALLGLGFQGPLGQGSLRDALVEAAALPMSSVVAVDIPSGLEADLWAATDALLPADVSVTFGSPKPVHSLSPGRADCGEAVAVDISFHADATHETLAADVPRYWRVVPERLLRESPWNHLGRDAHKFDRGHVLVIGGSNGKLGAPVMTAMAALRAGAGWASVALPRAARELEGRFPLELTLEDLFLEGVIHVARLRDFVIQRRVRTVVIGPGTVATPLNDLIVALMRDLMSEHGVRFVIDGGALNQLGTLLDGAGLEANRVLLTPHPGEYGKLGGVPARFDTALGADGLTRVLTNWGATLFYKSATPMAVSPVLDKRILFTDAGTNAVAKAGTGDVLAGVAAAHMAVGMPAPWAALRAQLAIYRAAETVAATFGEHGIVATDLLSRLSVAPTL